ncbi:MAG: RnfABCDGE type electron transport complex subunit D [Firmicutes bacterium]|nr:RnfABCDGE type electron transport complex subunit D [Bacillota bacterium]
MDNQNTLIVSGTPHIRSHETIQGIMRDVIIGLAPAAIVGIGFFGPRALAVIAISIGSAVFFEWLWNKGMKKPNTIQDLSAVVTGLLLAMNMPSSAPFWMPIVGSAFAIIICKQLFGGLGQNFINPALGARAFLLASYPTAMTSWVEPGTYQALTGATPLAYLKDGLMEYSLMDAFIGNVPGCIGETCALALIAGGIWLIARRIISWRVPVCYIGVVFVLTAVFGRGEASFPVYEILTGGLMLGAFFMATDYASSPVTPKGKIIMGVCCGVLTALIRVYGGYPEGVSYSILIMNMCVPLIDRYTKPKTFGELEPEPKKKGGEAA